MNFIFIQRSMVFKKIFNKMYGNRLAGFIDERQIVILNVFDKQTLFKMTNLSC